MKHWLQLVAIPNAPSSSSSQELQSLKKRISDLEKARSRSPRRSNQKQLAAASGPQMLALPALLPHGDKKVASPTEELVSYRQQLKVPAKVRLPRTSTIL